MPNYDEPPALFDVERPPQPERQPRPSDDDPGPPPPPVPPYSAIAASVRTGGPRGGDTFEPGQDGERLNAQHRRVLASLNDGTWWTLRRLAAQTGDPEASVSARIRDLRKPRFGSRTIERRRVPDGNGLHEYRLEP